MKLFQVAALVVLLAISVNVQKTFAGEDPILTRKQVMSNVGAATKALGNMIRGRSEFNTATAEQAMRSLASSAAAFPHYFPEGSETGGETEALPIIWDQKDDFTALAYKMEAAAVAGIAAAKADLEALKGAFGAVAGTCKTCHQTYRMAN